MLYNIRIIAIPDKNTPRKYRKTMDSSYKSYSFVRLNCHLLCSCVVCFFGSSEKKGLVTGGTRDLGRTSWVDSYNLRPIVPAAFGSLFVVAISF